MSDRILIHLPEFYEQIDDFKQLASTESVELILVKEASSKLLNNQFVMTADLPTIARVERLLNIQADPVTETIEFRRRRIVNRFQTKPPFTVRYLQQLLDALVGDGLTVVSIDNQNFVLTVTVEIENASVFREVIYTINKVKPANMVYRQNTAVSNGLRLKESISRRPVTWNYKLDGSWKLGEKAFASVGQEVPIV